MTPSGFLEKRSAEFLKEISGEQTVRYIKFDDSSRDADTGEITDEVAAYSAQPIPLPASVDFQPSQAMREKIGLDINFAATILLAAEHVADKSVTVSIGDAFILPGEEQKYYVKKIVPMSQVRDTFLFRLVAVGHRIGRR